MCLAPSSALTFLLASCHSTLFTLLLLLLLRRMDVCYPGGLAETEQSRESDQRKEGYSRRIMEQRDGNNKGQVNSVSPNGVFSSVLRREKKCMKAEKRPHDLEEWGNIRQFPLCPAHTQHKPLPFMMMSLTWYYSLWLVRIVAEKRRDRLCALCWASSKTCSILHAPLTFIQKHL